jgi:hypothetical protein
MGELGIREAGIEGLRRLGSDVEVVGHHRSKNTGNLASVNHGYEDRGGQQEAKNLRELDHVGKLRKGTWSLSGIHGSKKHQRRKDRWIWE